VIGAAVAAGDAVQNFSTGGNFEQVDEALSLYAGWRTGPFWANAVASYDLLQDHVSRQVPLGIFTDQNKGDSNGHALALALRGGWDFHAGAFIFGPLAGLTLQQVRLNGFTESGTTGMTALSFGAQTRNSAISQLGVRGSMEIGDWRPFAELAWNHELADRNRTVTASLTSIAAPAYFAAAIPGAVDWASVSAGTSYRINARTELRAAVSAMFINPQVNSYGAGAWLTAGF
jgi:outer membrane lipase/esterase